MTDDVPTTDDGDRLRRTYRDRFDGADATRIEAVWDLLYPRFLARYVPADGTVLDLGAGRCVFINRARAARRIAVDLNPDTAGHAAAGVEVMAAPCEDLHGIADGAVDLVFTSNLFEHLRSREHLFATLAECRRITRPGGRLVVLMPNLRATGARYFDFVDHTLPLTDRSLVEALRLAGYRVEDVVARFIPYGDNPAGRVAAGTSRLSRPAVHRGLFAAYLRLRPAWRIFGGQMLVVATRPQSPGPASP